MYHSMLRSIVLSGLVAAAAIVPLQAQETKELKRVGVSEFEIYLGGSTPLGTKEGHTNHIGVDVGFDARFNLRKAPVALGAQIGFIGANRTFDDNFAGDSCLDDWGYMFFGGTAEYIWNRGEKCSFFAGTGLGVHTASTAYLRPRVGGEFFNQLRVSAYSTIVIGDTTYGGFSTFGISIGYVFGGRPKKN